MTQDLGRCALQTDTAQVNYVLKYTRRFKI
jgi:hypothetical protein